MSSTCSAKHRDAHVSLDQTSAEHSPLTTTSIDQRRRHLNQSSESTGSGLQATFLSWYGGSTTGWHSTATWDVREAAAVTQHSAAMVPDDRVIPHLADAPKGPVLTRFFID
jgi:hypothetical protein